MLNRTAYGHFPPYAPSECSSKKTCVQRRKSGGCEVSVACNLRTGAPLLLIAAITSYVLFIHNRTPLVAATGSLRARSSHGTADHAEDISSQRQVGPALAPWLPKGAARPRESLAQAAEGAEKEKAPSGIPHYDVKARVDVPASLADEGRAEGSPVTEDSLAGKSEAERHIQRWPEKLYSAQRAGDERREGKDARGGKEAAKEEGGTVAEGTAFPRKEAEAEVERTEAEEEHEDDAKRVQSSAAREHIMDYGGKQEGRQGGEEGRREKKEDVVNMSEKDDKRAERKEKKWRQSSKASDDIQMKLPPASEKEGRPASEKEGRPASEKEGRPASEEGQQEKSGAQGVYTRSLLSDHPFCLFPNSPWCSPDLTAQDARSPGGVPDLIRRANAFVSSMLPLPFIYIPLSIPRFWSAGEPTSVEPAAPPRCRFTFTIPAMGPSEEVLLYMIPSQRLIGLTVGRNVKHSEKTETYSRVFDTETRMHAVSSFGQGCKASDKFLQTGLVGWSYAGKTDNCVKILVTLPSEPHAKELMDRKELSAESYRKFVEEEGLDELTPSEKCMLSGRTQSECEQIKAEAGAKRVAPITVSAEGYGQNEVRIPEFVFE